MDDYTEIEVVRFYNACAEQERDHLRTLAIAGRLSQADKKAWTDFIKGLDKSVKPIDKPRREKGPNMSTDKDLGDFFKNAFVLTNHTKIQAAADKEADKNKPIPRTLADVKLDMPFITSDD